MNLNSNPEKCILCHNTEATLSSYNSNLYSFKCSRCGIYIFDWDELCLDNFLQTCARHMLSGYTRELDMQQKPVKLTSINQCRNIIGQGPQSIADKGYKLLEAANKKTKHFGQEVKLSLQDDYPLSYAQNLDEFYSFIKYLEECEYISHRLSSQSNDDVFVTLTAKGFELLEKRASPPITVFISSTCYDLLDLQGELAESIESSGHIVKISEDPYRFDINPTKDSIKICIDNVNASDVVICVIDQRYGGVIKEGEHKGFSATEVEIKQAHKKEIPVYTFIRDKAVSDYNILLKHKKENSLKDAKTPWVKGSENSLSKWVSFVQYLTELKQSNGQSNWYIPFNSIVDLKKLVSKQLMDHQRRQIH